MPRIVDGNADSEIKTDLKRLKFLFVLFYLEYLLSLESEIRPIKCQICPLFTNKTQIKKSFVCFVVQIAPF